MLEGRGVSGHPADLLIRELIQTGRAAAAREIEQIIERMATAPFSTRLVAVREEDRWDIYQGGLPGNRAPSREYHLAKRIMEEQWTPDITFDQYRADLADAVRSAAARLAIYRRRGMNVAAAIVPTERAVPPHRRGGRQQPNLVVIYSADWGTITTGYQFTDLTELSIPERVRWLK